MDINGRLLFFCWRGLDSVHDGEMASSTSIPQEFGFQVWVWVQHYTTVVYWY